MVNQDYWIYWFNGFFLYITDRFCQWHHLYFW